jgi:hypothetical protein
VAELLALSGVLFLAAEIAATAYRGDAFVYWQAAHLPDNLYSGAWNRDAFSYIYPPVFAQVLVPLGQLPFPLFYVLWVALESAALVWLAGPLLAFALVLPYEPVQHELLSGNVNLVLAAGVVLAVRHPAWWALPILSKVTPGVALLHYTLRRDWHSLWIAAAVTIGLAGTSFLLAPNLWLEWAGRMHANVMQPANPDELLPLSLRIALALVVTVWGAVQGTRWTMVLAAGLALPNFVPMNLAYFVGLVPFARDAARAPAHRLIQRLRLAMPS